MCGKNKLWHWQPYLPAGSPPRVREKLILKHARTKRNGITPACAGKTLWRSQSLNRTQDHPRVCGKNPHQIDTVLSSLGSPPRVREKPSSKSTLISSIGITPACAGKTYSMRTCKRLSRDHPRVCGKNDNKVIDTEKGSRITPACAGKTACSCNR